MPRHHRSDVVDWDPAVDEREAALGRLRSRRDFTSDLVAYLAVNGSLVVVWALSGGGYFWPAWVIGLWGVGIVLHAWRTFWRAPLTEADVEAEMKRHRP